MAGPLPEKGRARRNAPTIPTTSLPVSGRKGSAPRPPKWIDLGDPGMAWWRWAWSTPQACAWSSGHEHAIARRASLEDDITTIAAVEGLDMVACLQADTESAQAVKSMISRLAALSSGRLQIMREMRELDDRLGLTPKALAALRWEIVADPVEDEPGDTPSDPGVSSLDDRRNRLLTG